MGKTRARAGTKWGRAGGDGSAGSGDGEFSLPYTPAVDSAGNVYVADTLNNRVQKFTSDGRFLAKIGRGGGDGSEGRGDGEFDDPYGVAVDCRGSLYVTDEDNDRVQKFGDPSARYPRCAPTVILTRVTRTRRGIALRVRCDLPCEITAGGRVATSGRRSLRLGGSSTRLAAGRTATLGLRVSRRLRRGGRVGRPVATVAIKATGVGGRSAPLRRRVPL